MRYLFCRQLVVAKRCLFLKRLIRSGFQQVRNSFYYRQLLDSESAVRLPSLELTVLIV